MGRHLPLGFTQPIDKTEHTLPYPSQAGT